MAKGASGDSVAGNHINAGVASNAIRVDSEGIACDRPVAGIQGEK